MMGWARGFLGRPLVAAAFLAVAAAVLVPAVANAYWLSVATTGAVFIAPTMACGMLYSRLGMVSLFQVALVGVGTWTALRLGLGTHLPFVALMGISGAITCAIGMAVSLPALWLSTIDFALLTLMAAGAAEVVFSVTGFPDGGHGFLGVATALQQPRHLARPAIAHGDAAYFRYVIAVIFVVALTVWWHMRGPVGHAWAVIRKGDRCAASIGIGVARYKLWAIALASFATGVGGALFAGQVGTASPSSFTAAASVSLFAGALVGGAFSLPGMVLGGLLGVGLPAAVEQLNLDGNVALIVFGIALLGVLASAPRGIAGLLAHIARNVRRTARGFAGGRG
jgi:branched-chain amino acid transport system permease protein